LFKYFRIIVYGSAEEFNLKSLEDPKAPITLPISRDKQEKEGIYMAGQVVALHDSPTTLKDLHRELTRRSSSILEKFHIPLLIYAPEIFKPQTISKSKAISQGQGSQGSGSGYIEEVLP